MPGVRSIVETPYVQQLLNRFVKQWDLEIRKFIVFDTRSFYWNVHQKHQKYVLKIPYDPILSLRETNALRAWKNTLTTPNVINFDHITGVTLLQCLEPYTPYVGVKEKDIKNDMQALLALTHQLHDPNIIIPETTISLQSILENKIENILSDPNIIITQNRLAHAHHLLDGLLDSTPLHNLLHGNLSSDNIVEKENILYAIRPLSIVGDLNYDIATAIVCQQTPVSIDNMLKYVHTHNDMERVYAWAYVIACITLAEEKSVIQQTRLKQFINQQKHLYC